MFSKQPISENVYKGVKTSKVTGSQWLAIKFLSYKEQKLQEAKILTRLLPHQNVVSIVHSDIYKLGPVDHIYIAMELCHEENLHDHITENKKNNIPFDAQLTISQAKQLVEGLNHIHENGVIHRDLKPNNVLLSLDKKTLKIADFGISKTMTSGRTVTNVTNARAGTDGYRAPETYNSNHISQRADIFSLGLVIYFLWSNGHHVFGDDPDDWNSNIKKNRNRNFGHILVPDKETAVDLLDWILQFQRKQRPRCPEILKHKYFGGTVLSPRPQLVAKSSSALQNTVSKEQTNTGKLNVTPALHRNDGEYSTICNTLQQLLKLQKDPMTRLETLQQIAECQIISKASCIEEINEIVSTCQMLHLSSRDMKSAADKYLDEFNLVRSYIMYVCASEIFRSESEPRIAVEGIERCVWRMSKVIEHMLERPNLRTIPASHIIPSMYEQLAKLRGIEHVSDDAKIKNEAMCLHIIGFSHSQLGEQEKALRIYRDSVELMKQQFGSSAEPLFHDIDETNVHKNKYAEIMKKVPLKDDQENETSGSEKG